MPTPWFPGPRAPCPTPLSHCSSFTTRPASLCSPTVQPPAVLRTIRPALHPCLPVLLRRPAAPNRSIRRPAVHSSALRLPGRLRLRLSVLLQCPAAPCCSFSWPVARSFAIRLHGCLRLRLCVLLRIPAAPNRSFGWPAASSPALRLPGRLRLTHPLHPCPTPSYTESFNLMASRILLHLIVPLVGKPPAPSRSSHLAAFDSASQFSSDAQLYRIVHWLASRQLLRVPVTRPHATPPLHSPAAAPPPLRPTPTPSCTEPFF
jgi:hypothetical protein